MEIISYMDSYKNEIIKLILSIQNDEAEINLSLSEQPDLLDINSSYFKEGGGFWLAVDEKKELCGTLKRYIRFFGLHGFGTAYPIRRNSRSNPKRARSNSDTCRDAFARR